MTTFRETIETYKTGDKEAAYMMFLLDPNSNDGISFEKFCNFMDSRIGAIISVGMNGEIERV